MENRPKAIVNGDISREHYRRAAEPALRNIPLTVCALLIGAVCLASAVTQLITFGFTAVNIFALVISLMLIGFTPVLPKMQSNALYKQLCASLKVEEGRALPCKAMLYDEDVVVLNEEDAAKIAYRDVKRLIETPDALALVTRTRLLIVFPKQAIKGMSAEDAKRLIEEGRKVKKTTSEK